MKISSGNAHVLYSGTVFTFNNMPLQFELGNEMGDDSLILILEFREDKENEESYSDFEDINPNTRKMILYNFHNPLGTNTLKPMPLGYIQYKRLYVNLKVSLPNDGLDRLIHYTFYLVNEEANTNESRN